MDYVHVYPLADTSSRLVHLHHHHQKAALWKLCAFCCARSFRTHGGKWMLVLEGLSTLPDGNVYSQSTTVSGQDCWTARHCWRGQTSCFTQSTRPPSSTGTRTVWEGMRSSFSCKVCHPLSTNSVQVTTFHHPSNYHLLYLPQSTHTSLLSQRTQLAKQRSENQSPSLLPPLPVQVLLDCPSRAFQIVCDWIVHCWSFWVIHTKDSKITHHSMEAQARQTGGKGRKGQEGLYLSSV